MFPERPPERLPNTLPERARTPARTPPHTHPSPKGEDGRGPLAGPQPNPEHGDV